MDTPASALRVIERYPKRPDCIVHAITHCEAQGSVTQEMIKAAENTWFNCFGHPRCTHCQLGYHEAEVMYLVDVKPNSVQSHPVVRCEEHARLLVQDHDATAFNVAEVKAILGQDATLGVLDAVKRIPGSEHLHVKPPPRKGAACGDYSSRYCGGKLNVDWGNCCGRVYCTNRCDLSRYYATRPAQDQHSRPFCCMHCFSCGARGVRMYLLCFPPIAGKPIEYSVRCSEHRECHPLKAHTRISFDAVAIIDMLASDPSLSLQSAVKSDESRDVSEICVPEPTKCEEEPNSSSRNDDVKRDTFAYFYTGDHTVTRTKPKFEPLLP